MVALAAWRIAFALNREEGPWGILTKVRVGFGVVHDEDGPVVYPEGSLLACIGCLSFWCSILLYPLPTFVVAPIASAAGAVLVHGLWERMSG